MSYLQDKFAFSSYSKIDLLSKEEGEQKEVQGLSQGKFLMRILFIADAQVLTTTRSRSTIWDALAKAGGFFSILIVFVGALIQGI